MDLLAYIEQVNKTETVEELYPLLVKAAEDICGYDRLVFSLVTDHNQINLPAGHGIVSKYPEDWMAYYFEKDFVKIDPLNRYGVRASAPFPWVQVAKEMSFSKIQKDCFYGGIESGMHHGIAVPLRSAYGQIAGIAAAVSDKQKDFNEYDQVSYMNIICQHFYFKFLQLHEHNPTRLAELPRLAPREREIMTWVARGKNSEEIAEILTISTGTVNWFINEVRKKYRAKTRMSALLIALQLGELDINDIIVARRPKNMKKAA